MTKVRELPENHFSNRIGWLRAAVLGANDGLLSTASLIIGVASAESSRHTILMSGTAGLVAGAMSMAAGEYVSVSTQDDTEKADLAQERLELAEDLPGEQDELAQIYMDRGLDPTLAREVALQLMKTDALAAHARDELGITEIARAHPIQAACASALSFSIGASLPIVVALIVPLTQILTFVFIASLFFLILLGTVSARAGGAPLWKGALRVAFWGSVAMGVTASIGHLFGTTVS